MTFRKEFHFDNDSELKAGIEGNDWENYQILADLVGLLVPLLVL